MSNDLVQILLRVLQRAGEAEMSWVEVGAQFSNTRSIKTMRNVI